MSVGIYLLPKYVLFQLNNQLLEFIIISHTFKYAQAGITPTKYIALKRNVVLRTGWAVALNIILQILVCWHQKTTFKLN